MRFQVEKTPSQSKSRSREKKFQVEQTPPKSKPTVPEVPWVKLLKNPGDQVRPPVGQEVISCEDVPEQDSNKVKSLSRIQIRFSLFENSVHTLSLDNQMRFSKKSSVSHLSGQ